MLTMKSITIEQIQQAVRSLFSLNPPKKHLSTQFIGECVQQYLQLSEPIPASDLITALRGVDHCVPRPMMRQKGKAIPEIRWVFVTPPATKVKKPARQRSYKAKPITQSLKLKMA